MFLRIFLTANRSVFIVLGLAIALTYFMLERYAAALAALLSAAYLVALYQTQRKVHAARVTIIRNSMTVSATPIMTQLARENPSVIFSSTRARRNPHQ